MKVIAILPFFFFLILSINVSAFSSMAINPTFDTDTTGILIYNDFSIPLTWNATYGNRTGVAVLTSQGNYTNVKIYAQQAATSLQQTNNTTLFDSWIAAGNANMILEAYKDGIVSLSYLANYTTYGYTGYPATPMLYVSDCTSGTCTAINSSVLTPGTNVWENYTVIVPATTAARTLRVELLYSTFTNVTDFVIDRFRFYTYDMEEARASYFTTLVDEALYYCGSDTWRSTGNYPKFEKKNQTLNLAYLIENSTTDNTACCVFQDGNITIARNCREIRTIPPTYTLGWSMRDLAFLYAYVDELGHMLIKHLTTNSINFAYYGICNSNVAGHMQSMLFNGAGYIYWSRDIGRLCNVTSDSKTDATVELASRNISGNKFNQTEDNHNYETAFYNFPDFHISDTGCTCTDSVQSCLTFGGLTSETDCGTCGCNAAGTLCDMPQFQGTRCNTDDTNHHIYETANGCEVTSNFCKINGTISGTCEDHLYHPDIADWTYGNYSVICYNWINNTVDYIVDATGANVSTSTSTGTNILGTSSNLIADSKTYLNNFFGSTYGAALFAFIVSIIFALFIFLKTRSKKIETFAIPLLIFLALFSLPGIEFFPSWFLLLQATMVGLMIFFKAKG